MANPFPTMLGQIDQLSVDQIEELCRTAQIYQSQRGTTPTFSQQHKFMTCLFLENSTRTKLSFEIAATKLGMTNIHFNPSTSSLQKGEDFEETLFTLAAQGIDVCVVRSSQDFHFSGVDPRLDMKLINGGDGTNEHPTQALTDLLTMKEVSPNLAGKKIAIIGDCAHSRVCNSLIALLKKYEMDITLCGPSYLVEGMENKGVKITDVFEDVLDSDFLYFLRVQSERLETADAQQSFTDMKKYSLNLERYLSLPKRMPIFHPGPVNLGVELDKDLIRQEMPFPQGQQIHRQVKNSIYMRMAIIHHLLKEESIT